MHRLLQQTVMWWPHKFNKHRQQHPHTITVQLLTIVKTCFFNQLWDGDKDGDIRAWSPDQVSLCGVSRGVRLHRLHRSDFTDFTQTSQFWLHRLHRSDFTWTSQIRLHRLHMTVLNRLHLFMEGQLHLFLWTARSSWPEAFVNCVCQVKTMQYSHHPKKSDKGAVIAEVISVLNWAQNMQTHQSWWEKVASVVTVLSSKRQFGTGK